LRADRQPEFTQIDCEMSFVQQEDILNIFEGLTKHLFKTIKNIDLPEFPRMSYADAVKYYGSDKPDIRFDMKFVELKDLTEGHNFSVFDSAEYVGGICANGCANYTRKQLDELTDFVKRPQIGAKGLIYVRYNEDGSIKSSVDKFYGESDLRAWIDRFNANPGDLLLILAGETEKTQKQLSELRLEMGTRLGLRDKFNYKCLWVVDFPLLEKDEELGRYFAKHHPFTSPKPEDIPLLDTDPGKVRAMPTIWSSTELSWGRLFVSTTVNCRKKCLHPWIYEERAQEQFGFLMNAFQYGAPPHGGIAFGLDRTCFHFCRPRQHSRLHCFPQKQFGTRHEARSTVES
jgi:aspartyl-tRNA synthetase